MKVAAVIFAVASASLLAWNVALVLSVGAHIWMWLIPVFGSAMLYQSYTLFKARPRARLYALISSAALTIFGAGIAAVLVSAFWPIASLPAEGWPPLAATVAVMAAFGVAFACLYLEKNAA